MALAKANPRPVWARSLNRQLRSDPVPKHFGGERAGWRASLPQRLLVERDDCSTRGGERSLDMAYQIAHDTLFERELTIRRELDHHAAQHGIVRRLQRDNR